MRRRSERREGVQKLMVINQKTANQTFRVNIAISVGAQMKI